MKIPYATDEEVDALVGPGFAEWWRANSPKPKTIKIGRRRLPEVTFGEHRWAMPPATIPYVKPPVQIAHTEYLAAKDLELAASLQKQDLLPSHILTATQKLSVPVPSRIGTRQSIEHAVKIVPGVKYCEVVEDAAQGQITIWVDGDTASDTDIVDAIMQTKPAGIRTMGYDGGLGARFMRGTFHPWANSPTLQPGMTVQPSVGGIMIASTTTGRVLPRTGDHARHKISKRIGIVTAVNHIDERLDVDWQDGWKGAEVPWHEFEFATLLVAGIPIFHSDAAPGHTTVVGLGASAGTKQGIIDAVMAVDNVVWCDVVEDNAAGKIHILVREDDVNHASRSEIIDAILQTKPAGVRAVGPIRMNGAAFQLVTKAELFSGVKLYGEISTIEIKGTICHDERPATVVTSRVRVCAKCGNQSKHAESETSMGLCFDCFEARR